MNQKKNQNILYRREQLYYAMSTFFPTRGFKWLNPKEFDKN